MARLIGLNDSRRPNRGDWFVKLPLLSVSLSIYAPSLWPFTWNHWPSVPQCCERHTHTQSSSVLVWEQLRQSQWYTHICTHTHSNCRFHQYPGSCWPRGMRSRHAKLDLHKRHHSDQTWKSTNGYKQEHSTISGGWVGFGGGGGGGR